ncbi:MAG: A/G-specific adenine glycosylase [Chloroflexota bacterium]
MKPTSFASGLLDWYRQSSREIPWRGFEGPYIVWVSVVMLQQTRMDTAVRYIQQWMQRFPTVEALASTSLDEVLKVWEGLGYYQRAHNLHRAAQILISEYGGCLPTDIDALRRLPGIGDYTAGAIASIAFGLDEPAVDANAGRVLARVFEVREPTHSTAGKRVLWDLARGHLPPGQAAMYNQALMDLGATVCTARQPMCSRCPLADLCRANLLGAQAELPQKQRKKSIPHHLVTAAVLQRDGHVLIAQRPAEGLLGNLWEFPGGKTLPEEDLRTCLKREVREELGVDISVGEMLGVYQHTYSHFRVTLHVFFCSLVSGEPRKLEHADLKWVTPMDLSSYPMGKLDRQIANAIL